MVGCGRKHAPVHVCEMTPLTMRTSLSLCPLWVKAGAWGGTLLVFQGDRQRWGLMLTICPCLFHIFPFPLFYLPVSLSSSFYPMPHLARHPCIPAFAQGSSEDRYGHGLLTWWCVGVVCRLVRHRMGLLGWLDDV